MILEPGRKRKNLDSITLIICGLTTLILGISGILAGIHGCP